MAEEVIGLLFGVDGGGSIDGRSGQQIVKDLTKIVNQINSGKSTVPKVQLKFDTSHAKKAISELKTQLQEIANMGNISVSGMSTRSGNKGSTANTQQDAENYRNLTATVKQYYAALAEVEKIQMKSTAVSSSSGVWSTTDAQYDARIQKINQLKTQFDSLGVSVNAAGVVEMNSAQQLNITEEQRAMLLAQIQSAITANGIAHEKSATQISATWDKNAAKVHEYILRMQDVASKNAEVNALMTELNNLAASGNPQNLDELTTKFAQLQQKVRETNADVQTFGQKLSKTFGSQLRYMLTSMVYMKALQFIRDLYNNVVELDKAMTNLQIASGKTRAEIRELTKGYADLAKQLGATTAEVAESADTWLRQGYAAEETNTLIKNSTMLSKLGQMEAAEASKALTSAMKGYKVEVKDSIGIVDKFTAVDMEAAASAGDIATAMAETATSADIAGVSMDRLIGYITTVKEVTQDGAESVGTFYKTLFARMNNVKAGKFIDDETGESLNDVEKVLGELGIKLRDANGLFRESSDVLDEVGERWSQFNNVQQHAIATAFAGTRQQEKFIVLMENYGTALGYAETAASSAGTAVEKFGAYTESVEGKLNSLKAAFEEFSMTFLDSELVVGVVEFLTWLIEALDTLVGALGGLNTVLYITAGLILTIKLDSIVSIVMKLIGLIPSLITMIITFSTTLKTAWGHGLTLGSTLSAAFNSIGISASAAQIAVGAFVAVLGIALVAINSFRQAQDEAIRTSISTSQAYLSEAQAAKEDADSLDALIKKYEELAEKNNGVWDDKTAQTVKGIQDEIVDLVGDQALALDLVNGKLETELGILKDIAGESNKVTLAAAQSALTDSKAAIQAAMDKWEWGDNQYYDIGIGGLKSYGNIKTETITRSVMGAGSMKYDTIKVKFDTAEEFAAQYEAVQEYKNKIAGTIDETNTMELLFYEELNEYLATYKDVYNTYAAARDLITELTTPPETSTEDATNEVKGLTVALKSAYDILEEVQDGYDGLANALTDVTSEGYLTADALSTLFKLESDNALAGLKLEDILIRDANGYKLAEGALQKYVQALIAQYTITEAFASLQDKENAIANLKTLQAVLATLAQTQEESTEADKARREELEKQQDAYNDQLDAYRELIDIRKDLLQTYEEELSYQKELAKRQRNVTALQTKLSVARLDQSAAGQARVRELEAELREAQEDLEDFTLEHAIDVLSNQLESQYAEYEAFIKSKLDEITALLEGLDTTPEVNITTDTSWVKDTLNQIETLIKDTENKEVVDNSNSGSTTGGGTPGTYEQWSEYWYEQNPGVYGPPSPMPDGWTVPGTGSSSSSSSTTTTTPPKTTTEAEKIAASIVKFGNASGSGMNSGKTGDNGIIKWNNKEYEVENKGSYGADTNLWKAAVEVLGFSDRQIFGYDGYVYGYLDGKIQKLGGRFWSQKGYNNFVDDVKAQYGSYHTGGLVGDIATLSSSEEFAKLLKGEFVSTPAQMKRFMEETLPQIVNYANGGGNEFNAPLIEILCENVTSESLPELERVVNEAVKEIKKQLDSGMSRTGYKRQATKRLT